MKYFTKLSFNLKDAKKVTKLFKSKQISKNISSNNLYLMDRITGGRPLKTNRYADFLSMSKPDLAKNFDRAGLKPGQTFLNRPTKIPEDLAVSYATASSTKLPKLTKRKDRKVLNSIIQGHEMDEITAIPKKVFWDRRGMNHLSPEVVLKEHNKTTTLSNKHIKVKEYMNTLRKPTYVIGEQDLIREVYPGYEHGKSQRISRHLRKKITARLEAKHLAKT